MENLEDLKYLKEVLKKEEKYMHAAHLVNFDQNTICPKKAMQEEGELLAFLQNQAFILRKGERFQESLLRVHEHMEELNEWDRTLIGQLYRSYLMEKNITSDKALAFSLIENRAFVEWIKAKEAADFSIFKEALASVVELNRERCRLRMKTQEEARRMEGDYDMLLDVFERGITVRVLDQCFGQCAERLTVVLKKIKDSSKKIRTDFLARPVSIEKQRKVTEYLLELIGFDKSRGLISTSEHAFTDRMAGDDIRLTTHFYPDHFLSNIYTVLHEGGHALFDQQQPAENSAYFITGGKTLGMHESVSRFYENVIGRSEGFIHLVYPKLKELMPEALYDVTERELYEAVNVVTPSLIRTEADEVTYTFHVIIRYELEKELFAGHITIEELPQAWDDKYEHYLGVRPANSAEGVLQDVHWTSDFGYFPTYCIGNFYNTMYYNTMQKEFDVDRAVREGDFQKINAWMKRHVFERADRLSPADWIKDITGRDLTAADFLDYIERKYAAIYDF